MPLRVALNVAYAMLTSGLDDKQRDDLDSRIYGWGEINERGNRALQGPLIEGGGEG